MAEATTVGKLIYLITGDSSALKNELTKSQRMLSSFGKDLQNMGAGLTKGLTVPIVAAGTAALKFAADLETQRTAFGVLLGDVERGARLFEQLKAFSAETPLQLEDITRGAQTLLAFGTAAEDVLGRLRMLGDLAQGDAARMQTLTEAYGKLQAKGRASLEELNRFTENGVPLMAALAKNVGVTTEELFKMISRGEVTFAQVDSALKSMTDAGGQFHDMMLTVSQTTAGKFSTAIDNLKLAAASLVESLLPAVNSFLDLVTKGAEAVAGWDDATKKMVLTLLGVAAAIGPVLTILGVLSKAIATNPYLALAGAIVAVTSAVIVWSKAKRDAAQASQALLDKLKQTKEVTDQETLAMVENAKAQAVLREQQLKPYIEAKEREVAVMERDIAALQEQIRLAGTSRGSVQALGEKYKDLVQKHDAARKSLEGMNRELKIQQETYATADKLAQNYNRTHAQTAPTVAAVAAQTTTYMEAVRAAASANQEAQSAEEDAALSATTLAEMRLAHGRAELDLIEQKKRSYAELAETMVTMLGPSIEAIGTMLVESSGGWDAFLQAAKSAIAGILEMLAKKWAVEAAAAVFEFNFASAAGLAAAAAAALVAAGAIRAMDFGEKSLKAAAAGADFVTSGPQLLLVGDNPGGEEHVQVTPTSSPNMAGPEESFVIENNISIPDEPVFRVISRGLRRKRLLVPKGSIVE